MNPTEIRWLPTIAADGPTNMAADETMLLSTEQGVASFRCYTWSQPTLSLGYFQPTELRTSDPLLAPLPWVRRASGGGAILHDQELTYCLTLPKSPKFDSKVPWICRVHHILVAVLHRFGVKSRPVICGEEKKIGELLCFEHQTAGDLIIGSSKILGSAQRRHRGGWMQHGSILLKQSPATPSLPGIAELSDRQIDARELEAAFVQALSEDTGWQFQPSQWTEPEESQIQQLIDEKYGTKEWNEKR